METEHLAELAPEEVRDQVMRYEEGLRHLAKQLGHGGQFEARWALRDAADLLLSAGRNLAAEGPRRTGRVRCLQSAAR